MKNCIIKLKECYGRLSKSEKIVADYILKNKLTASDLTISELSKKTNVSCSTINRLALNLGYDGYKEFLTELRKIGTNVNQIARACNSGEISNPNLVVFQRELKNIWQSLKSKPPKEI